MAERKHRQGYLRRFLASLGPGLITGAADDDPSGIASYSVAGAQFGTAFLWSALISWPLMSAVQMMCARIGMVTGKGLAGALREKFPRPLIAIACAALFAANTVNVGADLNGIADAMKMLTGINSYVCVVLFGTGIAFATIRCRYQQIANVLKWLTLTLFSYVIAAFIVHPDWGSVLHDTFVPSLPHGHDALATLVALLGTTISPYLFFWQSSMEVEEKKASGKRTLAARKRTSQEQIVNRKFDVGAGAFVSNLVMYFIILTTALTLHNHGIHRIETSAQAAEALKPFAGPFAAALFTIGIVGVGILSIPTLTGSAAYAFAETFGMKQGLDAKFSAAKSFYTVILVSTAVGIGLNFAHVKPVAALFWSAVINGVLAPFLLAGILMVACDRKIMHQKPSSMLGRSVVAFTTILMFLAAIGMFVF